jgi:hypothetical protein
MPLPIINHPLFELTIPSTKEKIKIRPMTVREEKVLLMAKEADDQNDILAAIKQVVQNCIVSGAKGGPVKVDNLALFDLEFLFIRIRSKSVNNISKQSFRDNEDEDPDKLYTFDVDLDQIEVKFPAEVSNVIQISPDMTLHLKYPSAALYGDKEFLNSTDMAIDKMVPKVLDRIFASNDSVIDISTFSKQEVQTFIDSLDLKTFGKIQKFIEESPTMEYVIEYTNSKGTERKIVLKTLSDFFTLE